MTSFSEKSKATNFRCSYAGSIKEGPKYIPSVYYNPVEPQPRIENRSTECCSCTVQTTDTTLHFLLCLGPLGKNCIPADGVSWKTMKELGNVIFDEGQ